MRMHVKGFMGNFLDLLKIDRNLRILCTADSKNEREYKIMGRTSLNAEVYKADARELTSKDLVELEKKIVSQQMAVALLETKAGRSLDRNIITQKCRRGLLKPMGTYRNQLYFYRWEVEDQEVHEPLRTG
jgi:hypothetical protein